MAINLLNTDNFVNLGLLDWPAIIQKLHPHSHFEKTKRILSSPFLPKTSQEINDTYDSLEFLLYDLKGVSDNLSLYLHPLPTEEYFSQMIPGLEKGKIADFKELNFFCLLIEGYKGLKRFFQEWNKFPQETIKVESIRELTQDFVMEFRSFVHKNGEVNYQGHPILSKIFLQIKKIETSLREEIQTIAQTPLYSNSLQYGEHDVINDKFVLAIRTDAYNKNHGPIVAKSNSGMTLFVEPPRLIDLGGRRIQLMAELEEAINKLCVQFSLILQKHHPAIAIIETFFIELDMAYAKAKFCQEAELIRPVLSSKFNINLYDFFHPLIKNPIKNDLSLSEEHQGLVISGPNTGGKTVVLKSIATCHLFLHFGLFLPISSGEIFPINHIFFFSNDQQNLVEGLSSFSSEVKNYFNLINNLSPLQENLILIDEIFNSTSSEEGSALAIALMEEINQRATAKIIISTHHQLLKAHFHQKHNYLSAHVGFDDQRELPTFKIHYGAPGSSMALSIFEKLSEKFELKNNISKRAKELIRGENFSYEKLLQNLSLAKADLEKILLQNREINKELKDRQASLEGLLKLELENTRQKYEIKIKKTLDKAFKILESTRSGEIKGIRTLAKISSDIRREIQPKEPGNLTTTNINFETIRVGDIYFSSLLNEKVKVEKINHRKKEVFIQAKGISLWCPPDQLSSTAPSIPSPKVILNIQRESEIKTEIDCRGMRLEEYKQTIETAILDLTGGHLPFLNIIHGHGDGVLKNWLREYLTDRKDLKWKKDHVNDGITHIVLV